MEHNTGFIGLGAMGYPMAKNVRTKMPRDAVLWIYDVHVKTCQRFKQEFKDVAAVEIASSARQVAENALIILSIVPAGSHVEATYLNGNSGVIAAKGSALDGQRLYIECSTIDIATARHVGQELETAEMGSYIDCPVSGGVPAADAGTLSMLAGISEPVGGSLSALQAKADVVLAWIGDPKKRFFCGQRGAGLAAKICNNYLSCSLLLANSEAMATGIKLGLDRKVLYDVIANSTGQNFMLDNVCPAPGVIAHAPSSNGYRLGFKTQMLSKDIGLAIDAARSVGIKPTIGEAAITVFDAAGKDPKCIDLDGSVVYRYLGGPE